ncbi:alpha/beta hydrolase family protein [Tomitella gaofuii]|uniref:alpha/beta hydrolase family protein n=1 Tax=Tomitella gaofuii TaxID=2760083 RepID=UPI0015FBF103|nr:alpha/beta fold hydrolase [Tomitella gaofuii]
MKTRPDRTPVPRRTVLWGAAAGAALPAAYGLFAAPGATAAPAGAAVTTEEGASVAGMISDNDLWNSWAERALVRVAAAGADFGEILVAAAGVPDGDMDTWFSQWTAVAERSAALARDCAARGHAVSARGAWLRAATYHQIAAFALFGSPGDRLKASFEQQSRCFESGAALLPYPVTPVEIPLDGHLMQGYFCRPDDSGARRPTVVYTNGYDGTAQEMFFAHVPAAIERGYNILVFDGPGQGRMLIRDGVPIHPHWDTVVGAAIDQVLRRPDVDADSIVLSGWSFGGFLAPRAACGEHRIAALIADPGALDQRRTLLKFMSPDDAAGFPGTASPRLVAQLAAIEEHLRVNGPAAPRWQIIQRGLWVHGKDTLFDYLADLTRFDISAIAGGIDCPTLLTAAENDPLSAGAPALRDAIGSHATLVEFTAAEGAGGHCESHARALYHQRVYDWLDETLGSGGGTGTGSLGSLGSLGSA